MFKVSDKEVDDEQKNRSRICNIFEEGPLEMGLHRPTLC